MTTNERLFVTGLIGEWDAAINAGDRQQAIHLLNQVDLETQAAEIVDKVLTDPPKYGFSRPPHSA